MGEGKLREGRECSRILSRTGKGRREGIGELIALYKYHVLSQ